MAAVAWAVWSGVDKLLGRSLSGQIVSVGVSVGLALGLYAVAVLRMRIPEARQIQQLILGRLRGRIAST
jgi:putative peptidoglycan lipid II flippase